MEKLKDELIRGLKSLDKHDRDLKTLGIWCNPNFIRGAERDINPKISKILNEMEEQGLVKREKKLISVSPTNPKKEFELWSFV